MTDQQLTTNDLDAMSYAEINTARREGRLNDLLRGPQTEDLVHVDTPPEPERRAPNPNPAQGANGSRAPVPAIVRAEQLAGLAPAEINRLRHAGQLDRLMGRPARNR